MTPWTWLELHPKKSGRLYRRIFDGLREVGVLLIAFAPLDAALSEKPLSAWITFLLVFLGGGLILFALALLLEWRFEDVD